LGWSEIVTSQPIRVDTSAFVGVLLMQTEEHRVVDGVLVGAFEGRTSHPSALRTAQVVSFGTVGSRGPAGLVSGS
jgi:hypothetical protein